MYSVVNHTVRIMGPSTGGFIIYAIVSVLRVASDTRVVSATQIGSQLTPITSVRCNTLVNYFDRKYSTKDPPRTGP